MESHFIMKTCLIGYTGFVGSNLNLQYEFTDKYNSRNIQDIRDKHYDTIFCCGITSKKWYANLNKENDLYNINCLIDALRAVTCEKFILISTIDVYNNISGEHDEDTRIDHESNHPYGKHRYFMEQFVISNFNNYHIIRLGGLFGFGLSKNVIYDLIFCNNPIFHDESEFQWYCVDDLNKDITFCINNNIKILNVFTEPISMRVVTSIFSKYSNYFKHGTCSPIKYNLKTKYGNKDKYFLSKDIVIEQINKYFEKMLHSKLCVSNLCYNLNDFSQIKEIEKKFGIVYRECVPFKTFGEKFEEQPLIYFDKFKELNIYSMQSILYPYTENIIKMEKYLLKLIDISSYLSIKILVLGSPKNRSLKNMKKYDFVCFMKKIGDYAYNKGIVMVIEPNSSFYNCDFIINSEDGKNIVNEINSDGVKLHLDTGCMFLEKENICDVIKNNVQILKHVHFSAPYLNILRGSDIDYKNVYNNIYKDGYNGKISIEMINKTCEDIENAIYLIINNKRK